MDEILLEDILNNKAKQEKVEIPRNFSDRRRSTIASLPERPKNIKLRKTVLQVAVLAVIITTLAFSAVYVRGNGTAVLMNIKNFVFNDQESRFDSNRLYQMIGMEKEAVLERLKMANSYSKTIGIEETYSVNVGDDTVSVIFTNGLCSGYSKNFKNAEKTKDELNAAFNKFKKLYGSEALTAENSKLVNVLGNSEGIKSMKSGDRYFDLWHLPRNPEKEKIIMGERVNEFNGLNIELNLLRSDKGYLITIRYSANRSK